MSRTLTIGHSPDPDDAFMFYAMTHGKIDTKGYTFREHLEGIEALNQRAANNEFEISAVSLHQFPYISNDYSMMDVGASMGDGYGPIVVSNGKDFDPNSIVAIPGDRTSAVLLLKLRYGSNIKVAVEPFDEIMDRVQEGKYDFGLLIHEGQLTYKDAGMTLVEDLGKWWFDETGLPTPLGINVIRRDIENPEEITEILRESIQWGFDNQDEVVAYARKYARGMEDERVLKFVKMYVNDFTLDLGPRGRAAVDELLIRSRTAGLIPGN